MVRKAKIAEKQLQMVQASGSCGSSFRSVSPVGTPDDNLTKVLGWMDKTEEVENVASWINVPPCYQQASVSAPVITVRSMHEGQCTAQVKDLKPSVTPTISREAAKRRLEWTEQRLSEMLAVKYQKHNQK